MAQTDEIADLVVKLKADVKDLTSSMQTAKKIVDEKNAEMKNSFESLGKKLAGVFAVSKIKDWALGSIKAYGESQRALERLGNAANSAGLNWDKLGKSVKGYVSKAEEMTRFNDSEVADSLASLVGQTKSMSAALGLNNKAMDLAVGLNISLSEASNMIALAYAGNERGLMQLSRAMRITGEDSKNVDVVLATIDKRFGGMAEHETNLSTETTKLANAWENFGKGMAETFEPVIRVTIHMLKELLSATSSVLKPVREFFGIFDENTSKDKIAKAIKNNEELILVQKKALVGAEDFAKTASSSTKASAEAAVQGVRRTIEAYEHKRDELNRLLHLENKDAQVASNQRLREEAKANAKRIKAEEDLAKAKILRAKLVAGIMQDLAEEVAENAKKEQERIEAQAQKTAHTIANTAQEAAFEMTKAYQDGTLTVQKAFEILGKAIFKAIVKGIGEGLVQFGAGEIAKGIALSLNPYTAPTAGGFYAAGAYASGAGGAMIGVAEAALADGGYVTKPTIALIGEAGPEKVTPLGKGHPLDDGGGVKLDGGVHLHYHGVKNAEDAMSRGRARQAGHGILTELDTARRRQGVRSKRGGA